MVKVIPLVILALFLTSCSAKPSAEKSVDVIVEKPPMSFALEDDSGNTLGYATPLAKNVLVAPDHLWQVSQSLYYGEQAIEVLARDFRHDLIFFSVPGLKLETLPVWSNKPPGVGQILAWNKEGSVAFAPVLSAKADFRLGNVDIENVMQLSVVTSAGSSGLPLYNAKSNRVYGMLIATDAFNDSSYFVRSDIILSLAEEYLGL